MEEDAQTIEQQYVCPFCGAVRDQPDGVCPRCTMESTAATRQATKSRIGPWYVMQTRNPAAPGMKFDTLLTFVRRGRVKARSIVRGPTTHQLWRFAAQVKGLSREFGVCYSCGQAVAPAANVCMHCNRLQDPPINPDVFLEADADARPAASPIPRDTGAAPLMAEDIVVPTFAAGQAEPGSSSQFGEPPAGGKDRSKKGSDGFLTAEDLATAFQLDFQPKERKPKKAPVSPISMTSTREVAQAPPKRRRRWKRVVILILLVLIIGVTTFEYRHDPNFRAQCDRGISSATEWTKQKWASLQKPPAKPRTEPSPDVLQVQVSTPSGPGTLPLATQPTTKPNPWDQLYNQPTSDLTGSPDKSAVPNDKSAVKNPEMLPPAPKHRDGTREDVWKLYGTALDAEGQHDYEGAIRKYEEIKEYPKSLWPSDLDLRLKAARLQMR